MRSRPRTIVRTPRRGGRPLSPAAHRRRRTSKGNGVNGLPRRKPNRLKSYDYSRDGAYFITICAKDRAQLFGRLVGATVPGRPPRIELSNIGEIVETAIRHNNCDEFSVDHHVVMPNHIHLIFFVRAGAGDGGRSPLQMTIRNMKSFVSKQIGFSPWQKSFHDHVVRDEQDYSRIVAYIENNPAKWAEDMFYAEEHR